MSTEPSTIRSRPPLKLALFLLLLTALVYVTRLVQLAQALVTPDLPGFLARRDFANYWVAGRLVLSGESAILFHASSFYARLQQIFAVAEPHNWSYPPHFLLLLWPLGFFEYQAALAIFLVATFALFLVAMRLFQRSFGTPGNSPLLWAAVAGYAIIMVIACQNGFLLAALMLFGLACMKDRPVLAGLAFACLTVKPQLGVLIPVLLIFDRNWKTIAWAAAFTALLVVLSIAIFGFESWQTYLTETIADQRVVMNRWQGIFLHMMPTVFGTARAAGYSASTAATLQWPVSIVALATVLWFLWKDTDPLRRVFVMMCGTFLVTPYGFDYDMGALAVIGALLAVSSHRPRGQGEVVVVTLVAMLAGMQTYFSTFHLPIGPVVLAMGLAVMVADTWRAPAAQAAASPA